MIGSVSQLAWRGALRRGPAIPDAQDLIAWASYFGEDGDVLRDCAALIQGFSPEAVAARGRGTAPPATGWAPEIAVRELEETACCFRPTLVTPDRPRPSGQPDSRVGIGPGIPAGDLPAQLGDTARALVTSLGDPGGTVSAAHLETLVETTRRLPSLDYRLLADGPADLLLSAIAATVLGDFVLHTRDLAGEPLGSPAFLHRSARFSGAGLGPWFLNVGRLVRTSNDVFDLARIACSAAGDASDDAVGAWIALLSRGCDSFMLRHLADDLADYGIMAPLSAIFDRAVSRRLSTIDPGLMMYLRDAALDNADYRLAAHAQAVVVRLRPDSVLELEILGSIQASGGELVEAECTFRTALAIDPVHSGLRARLAALGTPAFAAFVVHHGFGSPADRAHVRLNRRGVTFDYPRRRGERIPAVDVR